jgi:hypothetical protein
VEGEIVELSDGVQGGKNYADGWWEGGFPSMKYLTAVMLQACPLEPHANAQFPFRRLQLSREERNIP